MNHAIDNTWAAIFEDLVATRLTYERLLGAVAAGTWQDAIRLTLSDRLSCLYRLSCLAERLDLLVKQARVARHHDGAVADETFDQWVTDIAVIASALESNFDVDVDDVEDGEPQAGTADVDAVMALIEKMRPVP